MSLKLNISINEIHEVKICLNFIRPPCIVSDDVVEQGETINGGPFLV